MSKDNKIFRRTLLILVILIPISAFAHFILFPQQTRSILVDYSNFKKLERLYFSPNTPQKRIDTLTSLIQLASTRVAAFWGEKTSNPKYIYCEREEDFRRFGSVFPVPALVHIKFGSYIVISNRGIDLDIIAHELSHAELYSRIGFYNWSFKIPRWFDEGLAMQNDNRSYYSEDTLRSKSNNYRDLPDVKKLISGKQFSEEGTLEQIMLNFMTAKHEVKNWYTREKLNRLVTDLNSGKSFEEAFGK